jgi:hypothetical protein
MLERLFQPAGFDKERKSLEVTDFFISISARRANANGVTKSVRLGESSLLPHQKAKDKIKWK